MRMRYRQVTYRSVGAGAQHQLEQHYRRLLNEALRQGQQSISHRSSSWRPLADILESPETMIVKVELDNTSMLKRNYQNRSTTIYFPDLLSRDIPSLQDLIASKTFDMC